MISNIHTHTYRCHHATGTDDGYINRALEFGFSRIGFSDHAPFMFPDGHESGFRMAMCDAENYIKCIIKKVQKLLITVQSYVKFLHVLEIITILFIIY